MRTIIKSGIKSSFFWRFAGGFVLGAVGVLSLQPAQATQHFMHRSVPVAAAQR